MKKQTRQTEPNWYEVAHHILLTCKPLADRVIDEGVKLMLTDTDWSTLEGFELVMKQAEQVELFPMCLGAGVSRWQFDAMLDLYNFRKRR